MNFRILLLLFALCLALSSVAQQPPAWEMRVVDATLQLLRSGDAADVDAWQADVRSTQATQPAGEMKQEMSHWLADAGTVGGDLAIEKIPGGVRLILASAAVPLDLIVDESGLLAANRATNVMPENGVDAAVRSHVQAMEQSHMNQQLVEEFEQERFSPGMMSATTDAQRQELLAQLRDAARQAGGAMIEFRNDDYLLTLEGREVFEIRFSLESAEPYRIDSLDISQRQRAQMALSWDTLAPRFDQLAADGWSGVVRIVRDGNVVLDQAYGMANAELGIPMRKDSIFGIGSTPIDFTVAGVFLLADQGRLQLDSKISDYLPGVPEDKAGMTIRHLISGQSGLPDFHDQPGDWETDLAWIDREEALRRILAQPLGFAPGGGRAHSHSAYGLAAAIIELVSGKPYFEFMQEYFFAPAGMQRTGMYGDAGAFALADFAVGQSAVGVGLPNIPPNWGPTSWLVMGSGGMYSTLGDLQKFYALAANGEVLSPEHARRFSGERILVGGSQRGFHIVAVQRDPAHWAMFLVNQDGRNDQISSLTRALERLLLGDG